jgi:site-specific DNA recombinase
MQAAIYLRSSKDRSDVSIDAQRRELQSLAKEKGLHIFQEFSDAVESGKDDRRPGFQELLTSLKKKDRTWSFLLALDTSRIARNQYLAHALHYECEKLNIKIIYSKLPETGSVVDVVIRGFMQSFDQLHSMMSKEKGLSGMAENVKQGYRAGGRAPLGYALDHIETGSIRDGAAVTKSRLVLGERAAQVKDFLTKRVAGIARSRAMADSGLSDISHSTLVGLEWNALLYAGHTVWNVHNERLSDGGYKGGTKRRPRSDWVIGENTHPAMITTAEAELLIKGLEGSNRRQPRKSERGFLLTGLLFNNHGVAYHGSDGIYYRAAKGKRIAKDMLEASLVKQVIDQSKSDKFIAELLKAARSMTAPIPDDEVKALRAEVAAITKKIQKFMDMAEEADSPRPWLAKVEELEKQREANNRRLEVAESAYHSATMLRAMSESGLRKVIMAVHDNLDMSEPATVRDFIECLVEKIVLTESPRLTCYIHYRINSGDSVASPRRHDTIPAIRLIKQLLAA